MGQDAGSISIGEKEILNILFLRFGVEVERGVEFRLSTRNVSRILRTVENRVSY